MFSPSDQRAKKNKDLNAISKKRTWRVTSVGLLLLLQTILLLGLGAINLSWIDFGVNFIPKNTLSEIQWSIRGSAFLALAFLSVLSCIGIFALWKSAWTHAMLLQGLCLSLVLSIYYREKPIYVYPLMIYCIIMVINLNYSDVLIVFRSQRPSKN